MGFWNLENMFWGIVVGCSASFKKDPKEFGLMICRNIIKTNILWGERQKTKSFGRFSSTADDEVRKIIAMLIFLRAQYCIRYIF